MHRTFQSLAVVLALVAVGCSPSDMDKDSESEATSFNALSESAGSDAIEGVSATEPAKAAEQVVASTRGDLGCRTKTIDAENPNVVHVKLDHCVGRLGRRILDGSITLTFSTSDTGLLHAERVSDSLTIDGLPATLRGSSDVALVGASRRIVAHNTWTKTRDSGEVVTHEGDHVIEVDTTTGCRVVNGTGSTTAPDRQVQSSLIDLKTCETTDGDDFCPTGEIEHHRVGKDKTVVKRFNGTETVEIEINHAHGQMSRTETIACEPLAQ
ncbi:MAG: hypothetical protein U0165_01685 [Polyangiaceae bacterium]